MSYNPATILIHGDDELSRVADIATPINVSTTFAYPKDPKDLKSYHEKAAAGEPYLEKGRPIYSRLGHPNSERVEEVLSKLVGAHVVVYNSGLSAFYAALTYLNPKKLAIGEGYHGCHGIADIWTRNYGLKQLPLDVDASELSEGDVVHVETPLNPTGYAFDIQHYADKAHSRGAKLLVDATFAPPPLQDPFQFGADLIMHSATKYFGGHSDLLAGLLITKDEKVKEQLIADRLLLGTNIANLEAYLLLRSLRTYDIRIKQQSANAEKVVKYLLENEKNLGALAKVHHSLAQTEEFVKKQHPNGHTPVFSLELKSKEAARHLPSKLKLFHHATSLGGAESLVEWRAMSDPNVTETLLRFSIGLEDADDLINDLKNGLEAVKDL